MLLVNVVVVLLSMTVKVYLINMIPTTIAIPGEYNIYNLVAESGKQFKTYGVPFAFFSQEGCCDDVPSDISAFTFVMSVYDADCLVATITDLVVLDTNKLVIDVASLDIDFGDYRYDIEMVTFNTVISGKLSVI